MQIQAHILSAFAQDNKGGNPAAVVLDCDGLTEQDKQSIAVEIGMSETAFVSQSSLADFKLEFFTPARQIPHCGHATIATFCYLRQVGRIVASQSSKETIDGLRSIYFKGDQAFMEQGAPNYCIPAEDTVSVLSALGLSEEDLERPLKPSIVSTGNSFLLIPVKDEEVLRKLEVNLLEVYRLSEKYRLIGFYPFTTNVKDTGIDATTRMFAPYYGIAEEAATGMAAGPLACFLHQNSPGKTEIAIQQGKFMPDPSPSLINVILNTEGGRIKNLFAGGKAYYRCQKTVEIKQ